MAEEQRQYTDEELEAMLVLRNGMRKRILDRKPHIKEYYKARKLHAEVLDSMSTYYYKGKFEPKVDMEILAQSEPYGENEYKIDSIDIDLTTRLGIFAMAELSIYKSMPHLSCITEEYIQKKHFKQPEKEEFLQSMMDSSTGLFEITGTDSYEGTVTFRNVLTNEEQQIVDIGLSDTGGRFKDHIFTRIITYRGISFNAGPALIFKKEDPYVKKTIQWMKQEPRPGMISMFVDLYRHYMDDENRIEIKKNEISGG